MSKKLIREGVSYGRVSTFDQAFNGDGSAKDDASPQMQKFRCQEHVRYLNAKNEDVQWNLVEHLSDDGFSGKNTKRPAFQKLVQYIKSGKISFIIATELSRLSRNTLDFLVLLNLCEKHNVTIIIIGMNLDTSDPFGRVIVTILVTLAEFERNATSIRVKNNSMARLLSDGKINGAKEILGLDRDSKRRGHFIINHEEVEKLEKILKIFIANNSKIDTYREIQRLNIKWKRDESFTKGKFNSIFSAVEFRYRGIWPVSKNEKGNVVKLPHGTVVSLELLDKVQAQLDQIKGRKRKVGKQYTYLLSTLLVHDDGSKYTGQPAKQRKYRYYYNKKNDERINCDDIDSIVTKRVHEYLACDDKFKKLILDFASKKTEELPRINKEIKTLERLLEEIEKEECGIKDTLLVTKDISNLTTVKWLEEQINRLSQQKTQALDSLRGLESCKDELLKPVSIDFIKNSVKSFLGQFKKLPNSNKRAILEKIFHKIVIKGSDTIELHIFDDVFKETTWNLGKNKAVSSTYGLNGGSTGT